jgi:hypothetical protein
MATETLEMGDPALHFRAGKQRAGGRPGSALFGLQFADLDRGDTRVDHLTVGEGRFAL